jgi:predicted RNA methylase
MATDYVRLTENLNRFYNFTDKVVLFIGAAGRQLLDPSLGTKKLIAVDKDSVALEQLKANIATEGLQNSVTVVAADFADVTIEADVVYFEFCLHEMADPEKALAHAKSLASDIVVYDHSAGSEWVFYAAEEREVARSSAAMERFGIRQRELHQAEQRFATYEELLAKVGTQGTLAIKRAKKFRGATNIVIPMSYELVLL